MNFLPKIIPIILFALILVGCQSVEKKDANQFFLKGNVQLTSKNYEEALRYYKESLLKNPDFADAYLNQSLTLLELGKTVEAFESLSRAIEKDDKLYPAYLARAEVASRIEKWDIGIEDLEHISNFYSDSSGYYLIKGNLMVGKNDFSQATANFDKAISLDPANVQALVNRGVIYFEQKEYRLAQADFKKALELNPNQIEALNNVGLLAARNRQWELAISYFDKALDLNSVSPLTLNNKGYVLLHTGKLEEAYTLINRSLLNKPDNGYALRNLGLYFIKKKELTNAIETYDKALQLQQPVESLYGLTGEAYFENGNKTEACKIWQTGQLLKDSLATDYFSRFCH